MTNLNRLHHLDCRHRRESMRQDMPASVYPTLSIVPSVAYVRYHRIVRVVDVVEPKTTSSGLRMSPNQNPQAHNHKNQHRARDYNDWFPHEVCYQLSRFGQPRCTRLLLLGRKHDCQAHSLSGKHEQPIH